MSASVRFCLRLFLIFGLLLTILVLPYFLMIEGPDGASTAEVLREAVRDGVIFGAAMALLLGGLHVHQVRRLVGRSPSARELRPAHTCAVALVATPTEAADIVHAAVSALPGARLVDEDARAGWIHLRLAGGWRSWGTYVEILLVPAGHASTTAVITTRATGVTLVDYGASLQAARQVAERLGAITPRPLRASA